MKSADHRRYRLLVAALLLLISGSIFTIQKQLALPSVCSVLATSGLFFGVVWVLQPRQPYILAYEPRSFSSHVLKWVSAPQIEAVVLFWFGMSFLLQPEKMSLYHLTGHVALSLMVGWVFLVLGYLLLVQMPTPQEYTLIASVRLSYTVLVTLYVVTNNGPLVIIGAYVGGIIHGILSIALHWHLADLAGEVLLLKRDMVHLEKGR